MSLAALLAFTAIYIAAAASPGPGVIATIARVMGRGRAGIGGWMLGFVLGDLAWFWAAAFGLAALAKTFAPAIVALKYAGAAYLLYIAWKLWTTPATPVAAATTDDRTDTTLAAFLAALALTLGNPKVMVFFLAVLPAVVDVAGLTLTDIAELSAIIAAVMVVVLSGYVAAAVGARHLLASRRAVAAVNRGSALVLGGVALSVARA